MAAFRRPTGRRAGPLLHVVCAVLLAAPAMVRAQEGGVSALLDLCLLLDREVAGEQRSRLVNQYSQAPLSPAQIAELAATVDLALTVVKAPPSELGAIRGPKLVRLADPPQCVVLLRVAQDAVQLFSGGRASVADRREFERRYDGCALLPDRAGPGGPHLEVEGWDFDFGVCRLRESLRGSCTFENTGDRAVALTAPMSTAAGAPRPSWEQRVLFPGESAVLDVELTPESAGPIAGVLAMETDDPCEPLVLLSFRGEVPHELRVLPKRVLLAGGRHETLSSTVTVSGPAELELGEVRCGRHPLAIEVGAPEVGRDRKKTWQIAVTLRPDTFVGELSDELTIPTTDRERPVLTVPVGGTVRGDLCLAPSSIFLGFVKQGERAEATVLLASRSGAAFALLTAVPGAPGITITRNETAGGYSLTVGVPTDRLGVLESQVVLTTDVHLEEAVTIPLYAHVVQ